MPRTIADFFQPNGQASSAPAHALEAGAVDDQRVSNGKRGATSSTHAKSKKTRTADSDVEESVAEEEEVMRVCKFSSAEAKAQILTTYRSLPVGQQAPVPYTVSTHILQRDDGSKPKRYLCLLCLSDRSMDGRKLAAPRDSALRHLSGCSELKRLAKAPPSAPDDDEDDPDYKDRKLLWQICRALLEEVSPPYSWNGTRSRLSPAQAALGRDMLRVAVSLHKSLHSFEDADDPFIQLSRAADPTTRPPYLNQLIDIAAEQVDAIEVQIARAIKSNNSAFHLQETAWESYRERRDDRGTVISFVDENYRYRSYLVAFDVSVPETKACRYGPLTP